MALKMDINFKALPPYARVIIAVVPAILIVTVVLFVLIFPKNNEIKQLEGKIAKQENEIAKNQAKAARLDELLRENERLKQRLIELQQQLPEEKEVSNLLKQVSDLCIQSGMKIILWRPQTRKTHPSGIVYEIPVNVELTGGYHSLGYFFSSLTKLERIVNISNIKLANPEAQKGYALLKISFTATTFSSVPEKKEEVKKPKKGKRA